jgi:sialate O-acetylesterase
MPAYYPAMDRGLERFDGFVWVARDFAVPPAIAGKPLTLSLPAIDDCDIVWIDGVQVGSTVNNWTQPRRYAIPGGLAAGTHRITVCVLDMAGQGGFANGAMTLSADGVDAIDLAGGWKWRKGGGVPQVPAPMRRDVSRQPGTEPHEPAAIYNAMMAPCIAYPVRGTIWYQGESNAGEPDAYRKLLPLLMNSWRAKSGNPDMAWGVVQLAGFMPFVENEPAQGAWALLREAQYRGAIAGKGGMISATDLGDAADIHPRRKREVGERLAAWARNTVYGEQHVAWRGPELASATLENGGKVRLRFDHAQGLRASGDAPGAPALGGFALAGADGRFVWADAMIMDDGRDGVMLSAPGVTDPVEVVYAWQNNPTRANLVNGASLPAVPFRVKVAR